MELNFTGIVDLDREILSRFGDDELSAVCLPPKNRYLRKLCDENFFRMRTNYYYPRIVKFKTPEYSWKKFYFITHILSKYYDVEKFFTERYIPKFVSVGNNHFFAYVYDRNKVLYDLVTRNRTALTMDIVLKTLLILNKNDKAGFETEMKKFSDTFVNIPFEELPPEYRTYITSQDVISYLQNLAKEVDDIFRETWREK